jgi:hypothetical protein
MSIPILGQQPTGVCIVCKGDLTPDHEHIYMDKKQIDYMDKVLYLMITNGCMIPTEQGLLPSHPRLEPGYMWFPVPITNLKEHGECPITFPHHHCEVDHDVSTAVEES